MKISLVPVRAYEGTGGEEKSKRVDFFEPRIGIEPFDLLVTNDFKCFAY